MKRNSLSGIRFWVGALAIVFGLIVVTPIVADGYRFSFTFGWDLAQGAIPPDKDPQDPHFQYVEKKLGVVPLTQPFDWNGGIGYEQAVRLQMSGGKVPEAMQVFSEGFIAEMIESKVFIPLDDLLPKYAPLTWARFTKEDLDLIRSFSPDRKIYFIPWKNSDPRVGLIRKDWLARVGINKVPTTVDELLAAYKAFADKDANGNGDPNDEIPVSGREYLRWLDDLFVMHGVAMYEGNPQWRWDEKKRQFLSDQVSDEMKNAVAFIRTLYAKGYMDKTMPILKGADWLAKIEKDKVGHYFHTVSGMERRLGALRNPSAAGVALAPNAEFVYMPNVKVGNLPHQKNYAGGLTPDLAITIKAKDPAKILQWYDWIWTEEGTIYKFFGIEGLNYKREGSKIVVDKTVTSLSNKFPFTMRSGLRTTEMYTWLPNGDQMAAAYKASLEDAQYVQNTFMPVKVYDGFEDYTPSKAPLYQERVAKMIIGELPMEAWDAYVKEWYDKGGRVVTERATKWYKDVHAIK